MNFLKKKSFESVKNTGSVSGLNKTLTAFDLILLGLGAIVGTGVFALTGLVAAEYSGPAVIISYTIAGFVCIFVALAYSELVSMVPTSGSVYTYSYIAFGEVFAWLVGGLIFIEFGIAASAVSGSWSAYVQGILQSTGVILPVALSKSPFEGGIIDLPALLIVLIIGFMLCLGTKESKKINTILVFVKIAAITAFICFAAPDFDSNNWQNFMPNGFDDVIVGASILFFAFTGFGALASTAEECKNPKRDLTIGIIGSLVIVTSIYVLVGGMLTGIVPFYELNNAEPLAYALKSKGSNVGSIIVAVGAIAGMTTVIMLNIYGQSRIFYVIARDGLLPKALAKLHHKYDSPYIMIGLFTTVSAIIGSMIPYSILAKLASMAALVDYILVSIIVMMFRVKHPDVARTFSCPALFVIAPTAVLSCLYLLSKQIIGKNGDMLLTGKMFIAWLVFVFLSYLIRSSCFKGNT